MKNRVRTLSLLAAAAALLVRPAFLGATAKPVVKTLDEQVRHELAMLPYYSVFDNLTYAVRGDTVVLSGQVVRPTLKSEAENVVKQVPGVERVENGITVLPLSSFDDSIRMRELRAIYGQIALQRYGAGSQPSIHIIVDNGSVTLEGVVDSQMDKNIASMQANGVPGVFSVTNNLRIANGRG